MAARADAVPRVGRASSAVARSGKAASRPFENLWEQLRFDW